MTTKNQKKPFNNNYNHHKIFNDGEDLEENEQQEINKKLNVLEIYEKQPQNQQKNEPKKVNPTYKSQIFSSDYDEIPQFRHVNGQQFIKDQTSEQLFGLHEAMKDKQKRTNKSAERNPITYELKNNQEPSSTNKPNKSEKPMPFNAMWWNKSSVPNNDPSAYQADFAKQRKYQDNSSNNIFQTEKSIAVQNAINQHNNKNNYENNLNNDKVTKNMKFNIISNMNEDQSNYITSKQTTDENKKQIQNQIKDDIDARKVNRNYSNLFGRCQTPLIGQAKANVENQNDLSKNQKLFLPTNANIDQFDSRKYNPKVDKENCDMNSCQRYFKNLQSVLDTHHFEAEYKRGAPINKEKPAGYDGGNLLDNLSEVRNELFNNHQKPEKKSFVSVGEMEKVQQIEFKSMKNHFDVENFKRFCVQKGYKVLVFTSNSNGRGHTFLRENRKNPDPVDSVTANLKINGAQISLQKEINGKEFNSRKFEAPIVVKKSSQPPRPATGKKQFTNQQNVQSNSIFKEDKKKVF